MKPTKEELSDLADAYRIAANTQPAGSVASVIAYALRLAANMPSEEEIIDIIASNSDGNDPMTVLTKQALAIIKRLGVER